MVKKPSKKHQNNNPHKSFKRSYREDYRRELEVPGVGAHIAESFRVLLRNWKVFLPLLILAVVISLLTMGTEWSLNETTEVFGSIVFLIIWLTTIFLLRHIKAGHKVGLRDGLYNAMTPLVSSFVVFLVAVVQSIPVFLLIIAYSAAVQTNFLAMPFYALLFFGFALLMLVISGYLLSSTLIALVAVSAPGLYPLQALTAASDLMVGRRMKFVLRLVALVFVIIVIWGVMVAPFVMMKAPELVVAIMVTTAACASAIYATTYLYIFYRYMIDDK